VARTNPHWGTSLDAFLSEEAILETAKAEAREKIAKGMASLRAG